MIIGQCARLLAAGDGTKRTQTPSSCSCWKGSRLEICQETCCEYTQTVAKPNLCSLKFGARFAPLVCIWELEKSIIIAFTLSGFSRECLRVTFSHVTHVILSIFLAVPFMISAQ
eukprot:5159666-Amphidinium_carterae.1